MLKNNLIKYMGKVGFFDLYCSLRRTITKSQVNILIYHRVGPMTDKWSIDPIDNEIFEAQMKYLSKNFEIISLNNLSEKIIKDKIPKKAVAITFDDGYKDNYEFAFPILKKYNIPATIFLSTGNIEQKKLFWWDEVNYMVLHTDLKSIDLKDIGIYQLNSEKDRIKAGLSIVEKLKRIENSKKESIIEHLINIANVNISDKLGKQNILSWNEIKKMNKKGIDFGAHTVTHPILTNITLDKAKMEILNSKNCIEENLETKVKSFAYPNGDSNKNLSSLISKLGFCCSVTTEPGSITNSANELYSLNRIYGGTNLGIFKLGLSGLWGDLNAFI